MAKQRRLLKLLDQTNGVSNRVFLQILVPEKGFEYRPALSFQPAGPPPAAPAPWTGQLAYPSAENAQRLGRAWHAEPDKSPC